MEAFSSHKRAGTKWFHWIIALRYVGIATKNEVVITWNLELGSQEQRYYLR